MNLALTPLIIMELVPLGSCKGAKVITAWIQAFYTKRQHMFLFLELK